MALVSPGGPKSRVVMLEQMEMPQSSSCWPFGIPCRSSFNSGKFSAFPPSFLPYLKLQTVYRCAASQCNWKGQKCSFWEVLPFFIIFPPFVGCFPQYFSKGSHSGVLCFRPNKCGQDLSVTPSRDDGRILQLGLEQ